MRVGHLSQKYLDFYILLDKQISNCDFLPHGVKRCTNYTNLTQRAQQSPNKHLKMSKLYWILILFTFKIIKYDVQDLN